MKPRPVFSDMPRHIKERIIGHMCPIFSNHKLSLRRCSKEFRNLIDNSPIQYNTVQISYKYISSPVITVLTRRVNASIDRQLEFSAHGLGFIVQNKRAGWKKFVNQSDFVPAALERFMKIVKNPKHRIITLALPGSFSLQETDLRSRRGRGGGQFYADFLNSLASLPFKLCLERFFVDEHAYEHEMIGVLSYLEPGTLKEVHIKLSSITLVTFKKFIDLFMENSTLLQIDIETHRTNESTTSISRYLNQFDQNGLDRFKIPIVGTDSHLEVQFECLRTSAALIINIERKC